MLFLIFINDLPLLVKFSIIFLFADDTKCHRMICNITDSGELQDDLNLLYQWSLNNQLYFGIPRCFLLGYHLKLPTSYYLEDTELAPTATLKDLGVMVTSWSTHYDLILTKVSILSVEHLNAPLPVYYAFFPPIILSSNSTYYVQYFAQSS